MSWFYLHHGTRLKQSLFHCSHVQNIIAYTVLTLIENCETISYGKQLKKQQYLTWKGNNLELESSGDRCQWGQLFLIFERLIFYEKEVRSEFRLNFFKKLVLSDYIMHGLLIENRIMIKNTEWRIFKAWNTIDFLHSH